MTAAQYNEYQRQADVIDQTKKWNEEKKKELRGRKRLSPSDVKKPVTIYIKQSEIDTIGGMNELKVVLENYTLDLLTIKNKAQ